LEPRAAGVPRVGRAPRGHASFRVRERLVARAFPDAPRRLPLNVEFDVGALQQRFEQLDIANPEALQSMMQDDEELFGPVLDDEQRIKLARVQAFMSAAEGYGDHVAHTLGKRMLTSYGQIQEAMRRY